MTNSQNSPQETIQAGMTEDQFEIFKGLMLGVGIAYEMAPHTAAVMPSDREYDLSQFTKEIAKAVAYVNSLLATRDAEIKELESRLDHIKAERAIAVEKIRSKLNDPSVVVSTAHALTVFADRVLDILNGGDK